MRLASCTAFSKLTTIAKLATVEIIGTGNGDRFEALSPSPVSSFLRFEAAWRPLRMARFFFFAFDGTFHPALPAQAYPVAETRNFIG